MAGTKIAGIKTPVTSGWWVFIGMTGGVLLSGTSLAPIVLGIMSVALIYQTSLLLQRK